MLYESTKCMPFDFFSYFIKLTEATASLCGDMIMLIMPSGDKFFYHYIEHATNVVCFGGQGILM